MSNVFDNPRERIGTYRAAIVGDTLKEGLEKGWPNAPVEVVPVEREGNSMYDLFVKADPLTLSEMSAFVQGFFKCYNDRHKLN
jgi:hypothetical protein